ncbi:MAG: pilus assembly protein [Rhodoferax sp.]|nr:pilus assembly protein [Rhodoferax sp.]MDP3653509.1 pilus assembly protein [Rhodoferax sp.]
MKQSLSTRLQAAGLAATWHLSGSVLIASLAAVLVLGLWYPFPYQHLAGGRELFVLIVLVDVVVGPLLTLVLFSPSKNRKELLRDLSIVVVIQLSSLGYGLWTVWQARPLFLVAEIDRFKVIGLPNLMDGAINILPQSLRPGMFSGPLTVAIRAPKDLKEKQAVLFESIQGGLDYGERPNFYVPYEGDSARKSLLRARSLADFLKKFPEQRDAAQTMADRAKQPLESVLYLPVVARQEWIALLDSNGMVVGFLRGSGF